MKLINADKVIEKLKEHKSLFCKNRHEFRALSDKDKARVDEIDTCIAELVNAEEVPPAQLGTNLAEVGMDCISRQAAIDALKNDMASLDHIIKGMSANDVRLDAYVSQRNQVNYDIYTINNIPPAKPERPEPKRGEWLERDVIDEPKGKHITQWQSARCSVCGRYHTTPYLYSFTHYNFCPNCGAEMEVTT